MSYPSLSREKCHNSALGGVRGGYLAIVERLAPSAPSRDDADTKPLPDTLHGGGQPRPVADAAVDCIRIFLDRPCLEIHHRYRIITSMLQLQR